MDDDQIRTTLRDYLISEVGLEGSLADDESIFVAGLLDSMDFVGLIAFIEEKFGFELSALEVAVEDVDTVASMTQMIATRRA